jgi:hypothetical protein
VLQNFLGANRILLPVHVHCYYPTKSIGSKIYCKKENVMAGEQRLANSQHGFLVLDWAHHIILHPLEYVLRRAVTHHGSPAGAREEEEPADGNPSSPEDVPEEAAAAVEKAPADGEPGGVGRASGAREEAAG